MLLPAQTLRRFQDVGLIFSTEVIEKYENGDDANLHHAIPSEGDSNLRSKNSKGAYQLYLPMF
jgi:hypothetical protein